MFDVADLAPLLGVPYTEVSVDSWCEGKPPAMQELLRCMHSEQENAVPMENEILGKLLGREQRSVAEFVEEHTAAFGKGST